MRHPHPSQLKTGKGEARHKQKETESIDPDGKTKTHHPVPSKSTPPYGPLLPPCRGERPDLPREHPHASVCGATGPSIGVELDVVPFVDRSC